MSLGRQSRDLPCRGWRMFMRMHTSVRWQVSLKSPAQAQTVFGPGEKPCTDLRLPWSRPNWKQWRHSFTWRRCWQVSRQSENFNIFITRLMEAAMDGRRKCRFDVSLPQQRPELRSLYCRPFIDTRD